MGRYINWLFEDMKYAANPQGALYRSLIKESSTVDATTTVIKP